MDEKIATARRHTCREHRELNRLDQATFRLRNSSVREAVEAFAIDRFLSEKDSYPRNSFSG